MSDQGVDFAALYQQHREVMFKVAASVLREAGRTSDIADVVQEAMLSIMSAPPANVRNWQAFLVTAVKRKALDRIRSAEVRHAGPELDQTTLDRPDNVDIAADVADLVDRQRDAAAVWDHLAILDSRHRKALWETVALERPRKDVATELAVSPARVSQMVTRALELIRDELARKGGTP